MSFLCGGCGDNNKLRRARKSLHSELYMYKQKYRFSDNDIIEFRTRFNSLANARGQIDKPIFMESMGVLGLDSGSFLSERIFHVVDKDKDGYITLNEYLSYFDILIYGSQEEKYDLTFRLIDTDGKGYFTYEEFFDMITSMLHTWNNITGNAYIINQNQKLHLFLETTFQKFDIQKDNKVTLDSFMIAVSKEPELLEIFDYFNEGIIDAAQPPTEEEVQNIKFIQELEQLQSKVLYLKALIKNKGLPEEQLSLQRERTPKGSQLMIGSIFQLNKPEDFKLGGSPALLTSPPQEDIERKSSMLQSLDTKIRKSALFEHLKEGSSNNVADDGTSNGLSRIRSEIFRHEGSRKNIYQSKTDTEPIKRVGELTEYTPNRLGVMNLRHIRGLEGDVVNTLDGMLETSPKVGDNARKLSTFASRQSSPDENHMRNMPVYRPEEKRTSLTKAEAPTFRKQNSMSNGTLSGSKKSQEEIHKREEHLHLHHYGSPHNHHGMEDSYKLQVIREEKTFDDPSKIEDSKGMSKILRTPDHKRSKTAQFAQFKPVIPDDFPPTKGLYESRWTGKMDKSDNNDLSNDRSKDHQELKHKRPEPIMIQQPKFVDTDDIQFTVTKSKKDMPGKMEEAKLTDLQFPALKFNNHHPPMINFSDTDKKSNGGAGGSPHLKLNDDVYDFRKSFENKEEERIHLISQQVDLIADETVRMIEELEKRKKQAHNKDKKGQSVDEKKMEKLKEVTAQNIAKPDTKKGNFVSFGHQNWNLVLNMMLGIQKAVNSTVERSDSISHKDFGLKYIFELVSRRTGEVKDSYKICTFFDYAPNVFLELRRLFGIKNEDYLKSIGPESMLNGLIRGNLNTLAELTSSGKSGSFFYYSADGKYTLKTISRAEFHFLRKILRNYYNHIMNNANTLVIKFYGLHKMRFVKSAQRATKLYFVIMANVFHTSREIHVRYDLKGSTQGRITKSEDASVARKDLNILQDKVKLLLTKDVAETFTNILDKDAAFFEENSIIDYSLLVGIHNLEQEEMSTKDISQNKKLLLDFKLQSKEGILSGDGSKIYFLGVIDILTEFNARKRSEYLVKRIAYGKGISAIPPPQYAKRFLKFIKELIESH